MKRALIALLVIALVIGALTAWVVLPVASRLESARDAIAGSSTELRAADLKQALTDLQAADDRLGSLPAKALGLVPVIGANVGAVRSVTEALIPVVRTAGHLQRSTRSLREGGLFRGGRARPSVLAQIAKPLADEVAALSRLEIAANDAMTGALLPPLWDEFEKLASRASSLRRGLDRASVLVRRSPDLLGVGRSRRYLILLMNNAELRGAGGVLTGIGSLRFDDGKLELEAIDSVHDLDVEPKIEVPSPPTYERRFNQFEANTTLWLNTTYSPDVPDVAIVASRLYERVTGLKTHGAIVTDPRGLAALLNDDVVLELDNFGDVPAADLPRVVYSDAYDAFEDPRLERREALLDLGVAAFESFIDQGLPEDGTQRVADAVSGGHLGFVSFDAVEERALADVGASHDLPAVRSDVVLVTVQNLGGGGDEGTKLDYWASRSTEHACDLTTTQMTCATTVRLENRTPKGLSTYVAGRPYGLMRSYLEVYVPGDAVIEDVRRDGRSVDFRPDPHDDMTSIAVYLEIPRGEDDEVTVVYRAPLDEEGYRLIATPQPLAHDARLSIALQVPDGWSAIGPGDVEEGRFRYVDEFDEPIEVQITPDDRAGLSGLWQSVQRFWNEPLF